MRAADRIMRNLPGYRTGSRRAVSGVYFLQGEHSGRIKIGETCDLWKRLQGYTTPISEPLVLISIFDPGQIWSRMRDEAEFFEACR